MKGEVDGRGCGGNGSGDEEVLKTNLICIWCYFRRGFHSDPPFPFRPPFRPPTFSKDSERKREDVFSRHRSKSNFIFYPPIRVLSYIV